MYQVIIVLTFEMYMLRHIKLASQVSQAWQFELQVYSCTLLIHGGLDEA